MFGIGFGEISVIAILAIIILGPKEFVKYIKMFRELMGKLTQYKREIESEIRDRSDFKDTEKK